ncbi:glycosyl hydrolase family 2, sugar binding domain protein [Streptomyces turgidiscabies Car8]|uniref:beta-galactosidase n=1 Tax=Streptomyces turgidiscabies (strain Car8) TaxID=698760 RepID=L7FIK2_STRT8|nr:glycosyl hydrolase family 2, sugar binding domain protein [Streptomyces turgidiscabies Car8]
MTIDPLLALRPWESPEVTSWGRLPMNAVDRRAQARSLDGDWRFQLLPTPTAEVGDDWSSARVPGAWTLQGTDDLPWYTNVQMPWADFPPGSPVANPTGVYEREFDIPAEWAGRRIVLQSAPPRACCSCTSTGGRSASPRTPIWRPSSTSPTSSGPAGPRRCG